MRVDWQNGDVEKRTLTYKNKFWFWFRFFHCIHIHTRYGLLSYLLFLWYSVLIRAIYAHCKLSMLQIREVNIDTNIWF